MSKKIKIFRNKNTADLCKSVNEFCVDHRVLDIMWVPLVTGEPVTKYKTIVDQVCVVYEDYPDKSVARDCSTCRYKETDITKDPCKYCQASCTKVFWEAEQI